MNSWGIRNAAGTRSFGFSKTTAGWVVTEYRAIDDMVDIVAGAFAQPADAVDAARFLLNSNLDEVLNKITAASVASASSSD